MSMRVQCSLLITDDKLAEDLIRPLKNSKQLAPFVLKVLSAYYYDEGIRSAIDGSSFEQDDGFMDSINQQFKETREAFQLLNYYTQSADSTIASGIQQMKEVVSAEPDKFGLPIGKMKDSPVDAMHQAIDEGYRKKKKDDERIDLLENSISDLKSVLSSILNKVDSISTVSIERSSSSAEVNSSSDNPVSTDLSISEGTIDDASVITPKKVDIDSLELEEVTSANTTGVDESKSALDKLLSSGINFK